MPLNRYYRINHYRHGSNGKEVVSTWGELTNAELLILDSNCNGAEMLLQCTCPKKGRQKPKQQYVGEDRKPSVSTLRNINTLSRNFAQLSKRRAKMIGNALEDVVHDLVVDT